MNLWMKQMYVDDILSGRKTDTLRLWNKRYDNLALGQSVSFSVGARRPFAYATIVNVQHLVYADADAPMRERMSHVVTTLGRHSVAPTEKEHPLYEQMPFVLITFQIKNSTDSDFT